MKLPSAVKKKADQARAQHAGASGQQTAASPHAGRGEFLDVPALTQAPAPSSIQQVTPEILAAQQLTQSQREQPIDKAAERPRDDETGRFIPHALAGVLNGGHPSAGNVAAIGAAPRDLSALGSSNNDPDHGNANAKEAPDFVDPSDWEARYKAFRAADERKITKLKRENTELKANLDALQVQLDKMSGKGDSKAAPRFELDEGTRARLGEDQAKVFDQFNNNLEERFARDDKRQQEQGQREDFRFRSDLTSMVPRWEEINVDPAFLTWLNQTDDTLGMRRQDMLDRFVGDLDAGAVAALFRSFAARNSDTHQRNGQHLSPELNAARAGSGLGAEEVMVEVWGQSEIADFYNTKSRLHQAGKLKGATLEKVKAEEQRIRTAMEEGRVDFAA